MFENIMVFEVILSFFFSSTDFDPTIANFAFFAMNFFVTILKFFLRIEHFLAFQTKTFLMSLGMLLKITS